jgi:hypothetical protein
MPIYCAFIRAFTKHPRHGKIVGALTGFMLVLLDYWQRSPCGLRRVVMRAPVDTFAAPEETAVRLGAKFLPSTVQGKPSRRDV